MTPEQFCYWLNGFVELSGDCPPTAEQWKSIREHIQTVFSKVTPPVGGEPAKTNRSALEEYCKALSRQNSVPFDNPLIKQGKYWSTDTSPQC
jgi:hypothetical protein